MWNKIYMVALGISLLLTAVLTYYSYTWLQSIGAPVNVVQNYDYYSNIGWMFLCISTLVLLVFANIVLWTTGNSWAMWATFLYFAVFILVQTLGLDRSFFNYRQQNGLADRAISLSVFSGILFPFLALVIVFFNQYIVKKMRDKMSTQPGENLTQEVPADKNRI